MDAILKSQAEKLANELAIQVTTLEDLNGLMRTMMKTALERMLNTEMDVHLQRRGQTPCRQHARNQQRRKRYARPGRDHSQKSPQRAFQEDRQR